MLDQETTAGEIPDELGFGSGSGPGSFDYAAVRLVNAFNEPELMDFLKCISRDCVFSSKDVSGAYTVVGNDVNVLDRVINPEATAGNNVGSPS